MSNQTADVVVIGMGPGGEDVAGKLAEAGFAYPTFHTGVEDALRSLAA